MKNNENRVKMNEGYFVAGRNADSNNEVAMPNKQKRWESLPKIENETVLSWLDQLLESKNKTFVEELTSEEIKEEIKEIKGSIDNFHTWGDKHAIIDCEEYIEVLQELVLKLD